MSQDLPDADGALLQTIKAHKFRNLISEHTKPSDPSLEERLRSIPCTGWKILVRGGWIDPDCVTKDDLQKGIAYLGQGPKMQFALLNGFAKMKAEQGECVNASFNNLGGPPWNLHSTENAISTGLIDPEPRIQYFMKTVGSVVATGKTGNLGKGKKATRKNQGTVSLDTMIAAADTFKAEHKAQVKKGLDFVSEFPASPPFLFLLEYAAVFDAYGDHPNPRPEGPHSKTLPIRVFKNLVLDGKPPTNRPSPAAGSVELNFALFPNPDPTNPQPIVKPNITGSSQTMVYLVTQLVPKELWVQ